MAITQVIDAPPTAPNRATMDDATYSAAADAMMAYLKTLTSEANLWATQANLLAGAMNAVAAGAAYSIAYTFDTTTADADPGNGKLRLDNATQGSATTVRMDLLDQAGTDWTAALDQFDGSTSTVKGYLTLRKLSDGTKWALFSVSARAAPTGYRNISVAVVAISGSNPFANGDTIVAEFSRTGDKGSTGPASWATGAPAWVTSTAYTATAPASVVTTGGETYLCIVSHTSGAFATDLAANKWIKLAAKGADGASGAWTLIGTVSPTAGQSSVAFTGISTAYTDLMVVWEGCTPSATGITPNVAVGDAAPTYCANQNFPVTSGTSPMIGAIFFPNCRRDYGFLEGGYTQSASASPVANNLTNDLAICWRVTGGIRAIKLDMANYGGAGSVSLYGR